jgi:hypothetical protein
MTPATGKGGNGSIATLAPGDALRNARGNE